MSNLVFNAELRADAAQARAEIDAAKNSVKGLTSATEVQTTKARASVAATDLDAAAKRRNAQASTAMATANRGAAAATGNLTAQFNDIGVMLASGQNPLLLAIQQGSQIAPILGSAGAAGAVGLLKAGFLSLISPVNLVTIGVIAAGGALVQWLSQADEEVASLEDQIGSLRDAITSWREESAKTFADLRDEFGGLTPEIVQLQQELVAIDLRRIAVDAGLASNALRAAFSDVDIQDLLGLERINGRQIFPQIAELQSQIDAAMTAAGPLEQADGWAIVATTIRDAAGGVSQMSAAQLEVYRQVIDTEAALRAAAIATSSVAEETGAAAGAAGGLNDQSTSLLATLTRAAGLDMSGIFSRAYPAAQGLLGIARGILTTVSQAAQQAAATEQLRQMAIEFSPGGQALMAYGGRTPGGTSAQNALGVRIRPAAVPSAGRGGGGGGGGAARQEADAVKDLVEKLQEEIEALRITDPVQRELLQHRSALAGATAAERAQVEQLIATRERERLLVEAVSDTRDFFADAGETALDGLIAKGQSLNDVLEQIGVSLAKAAIQAAIFGTGPLGGLFGNKGIGSLIFAGGKAAGGMIYGAGSGTSDSIPTLLSNGEFVVNARATAANRNLLEAINANGPVGRYAGGGMVGRGSSGPSGYGPEGGSRIVINLAGARGNREIEDASYRGMQRALKEYDRNGAPATFQRVAADPRRIG